MRKLDPATARQYNHRPSTGPEARTIETRELPRRTTILALIVILLIAAGIRIYLIATTEIVSRDGITFAKYARALGADPLPTLRDQAQHPLYPLAVLLVYSAVGRWLAAEAVFAWPVAGQIASMLGGMVAVWAAYALGRVMWDRRVGLTTALFAAVLPELCQVSGDALSDGLHLGLYLCGLVAVLQAWRVGRPWWLIVAGGLSGLAFLTRPEGGSILVIGLAMVAMGRRQPEWTWRRRFAGGAILLASFSVVAGPYMVAVGRVVQKKNIFELFGLDESRESAAVRGVPADAPDARAACLPTDSAAGRVNRPARAGVFDWVPFQLLYHWGRACRLVYLLLALPALSSHLVTRPRGARFLLIAFVLHMCLLYALFSSYGYLSLRHLLVPAALTLPFAAATCVRLVDQISVLAGSRHDRRARVVRPIVYLVTLTAVIGPTLPRALRPLGQTNDYLIAAGRWLHEHSQPGQTVLTTRNRIAYSAELTMLPGPDTGQMKHLASYIRQLKPTYYVVEASHVTSPDRNPDFFADLEASPLGKRLAPIHEERARPPNRKGRVLIYRVDPSATSRRATAGGGTQ